MLRISNVIDRGARSNGQATRFGSTLVIQIVTDLDAGLKGGGANSAQERLLRALDYGDFAGKDIHHLVFGAVPLPDVKTGMMISSGSPCLVI
jgi:hypothetical protein